MRNRCVEVAVIRVSMSKRCVFVSVWASKKSTVQKQINTIIIYTHNNCNNIR